MAIDIAVGAGSGVGLVNLDCTGMIDGDFYTLTRSDTTTLAHNQNKVVQDGLGVTWSLYQSTLGATFTISDFEAPLFADILYTLKRFSINDLTVAAETDTVTRTQTSTFSGVSKGLAIISSPSDLDLVNLGYNRFVTGTIVDFQSTTRSGKLLGSHQVLGRTNPVVISDGAGGRTGTLSLVNIMSTNVTVGSIAQTASYDVQDSQENYSYPYIFETGDTLYFRSDWRSSGIDDFYFKPTRIEQTRASRVIGYDSVVAEAMKVLTIDFVEVDPFVAAQATDFNFLTWAAVAANNATWADVTSGHTDWASVLSDP